MKTTNCSAGIMGNICFKQKTQKSQPPKDLTTLLKDASSNSSWVDCFRNHLEQNNIVQTKHLLEFVLDFQILKKIQNDLTSNHPTTNNWKSHQEKLAQRNDLLAQIFEKYFNEENDQASSAIPLTNQVLRDEICIQLKDVICEDKYEAKEIEFNHLIHLLQEASRDHRVWKAGIEVAYAEFLASKPNHRVTTQIAAVLLSII